MVFETIKAGMASFQARPTLFREPTTPPAHLAGQGELQGGWCRHSLLLLASSLQAQALSMSGSWDPSLGPAAPAQAIQGSSWIEDASNLKCYWMCISPRH